MEIAEGKQIEYQGYIYTIYTLVRSNMDQPGSILLQVLENTDRLVTGLKNLNSNIKHYIDELTRHSSVAEIMDALFNDYITNIVDKAYHRLLTSDNVSKFRPEIIERLESKSRSRSYVKQAAAEIAAIREISEEEATELVYHLLHQIIEAFRNMDDILNEINQKNTQYQRAAINRAKFLLSGNEDVRGQLKEILIGINEAADRERMDLGGIYRLEFLDQLVRIYSCGFLDENSFYSPVEGRKEFTPFQVEVSEPDLQLPQVEWLHFGDIDVGGFEILFDLRKKTGIPFWPYRMDAAELMRGRAYARELTEHDRKRLKELLQKEEIRDLEWYETLVLMQELGVKQEQECVEKN